MLAYTLAVTVSKTPQALIMSAILPAFLILRQRFSPSRLRAVNVAASLMVLTLALTWPDAREGFVMGMVILVRVNMICAVFAAMVEPLGTGGMYEALSVLHVPEKLRVLVILTLRGIYTLRERYESAIISVRLRAPNLRGVMRLKVFANIVGSVMLQASLRSENMARAVKCRGGFSGFMQAGKSAMTGRDWVYAAGMGAYSVMIAVMNYA
ncbi:MAG: hypothetical protein IJG37_07705 [Synergistaceae bacterium]|nr:hypothetical protein [Synergistaceae bacterium]